MALHVFNSSNLMDRLVSFEDDVNSRVSDILEMVSATFSGGL